ncbi:MAG: hypothetical protein Hyperionvirus20_3 [Hyperionvirus sp.]|uniref:Uncharacterized protein n=1 Tax=Hyperionvirus sp. TaxID=2487770 RepID=A0A3G5AAH3_9VIRU|nr:MAG: hypothetical protein Hyperionvirus20_3 [Hyperionvirus sp.]
MSAASQMYVIWVASVLSLQLVHWYLSLPTRRLLDEFSRRQSVSLTVEKERGMPMDSMRNGSNARDLILHTLQRVSVYVMPVNRSRMTEWLGLIYFPQYSNDAWIACSSGYCSRKF